MNSNSFRRRRFFYVCLVSFALAACGGGGGDDTGGNGNPPPGTSACTGTGSVTISGKVEYEFVPAVAAGLDFNNSEFRPVRKAAIEALCPDDSTTYASTVSDDSGAYSLTVPENVDVVIRARAAMTATGAPGWNVSVVDNTRSQAAWALEGDAFDSGTGTVTLDLRAESGWTGAGYTETRAAAPFAILDSVYTAMQRVLTAEPAANFPALKLNWSPQNRTCTENNYPYPGGCIGTSFYFNPGSQGRNIFILGDADGGANSDTDEFDNHVVIHEWGHYYEDAFARSDSIGGAHGGGDQLDPRVAFGEGWGNAWSAIATDDPIYVDTMGSNHSGGFSLNIEGSGSPSTGWWNEAAVQEIIYDLYDGTNDDGVNLGFGPLHEALTDGQRDTEAMTTLFSFIKHVQDVVGDATAITTLLQAHQISPINDIWGDGRTALDNGAPSAGFVTPVHELLADITDGATENGICTTNTLSSTDEYNRLGVRRFLRFTPAVTDEWLVTLKTNPGSDPDFLIFTRGQEVTSQQVGEPDFGQDDSTSDGIETAVVSLTAGTQYVIEVLDYLNADSDNSTGGANVCLDLTFELN